MYVIVVGGGNTGSYLTRLLLDGGQRVTVIEERPSVLDKLRLELPLESIIEGDGSSPTVLEKAQVSRANVLAAVTGSDETNLVITSLARFEFSVPRVIARVNNPKNTWLFNAEMGVDVSLNQAEILAQLVAEEMSLGDMMTLLKLRRGEYSVVEEKVPPGAKGIGIELRQIDFKEQCVIAAIIRNGKMTLPRGDSVFEVGDEVVAIASPDGAKKLAELLAFKVYPTREPGSSPPA
jgi:trk system potassium uptake protein TrkA